MDDNNEIESVQWEKEWGTEELQLITLEELPLASYPPPLDYER